MAEGRQVSLYLRWDAVEAITRHVERTGQSRSQCATELLLLGDRVADAEDVGRLLAWAAANEGEGE